MNEMDITGYDLQSILAQKLRKHMEDKRQALRAKNEADLDPILTAKVRGEIKAYKDLLNLLALSPKTDQASVADEEQPE